ncbi:ABC transporter substrate-binding protein [Caldimonas brevitalea]|uniref:Nitrate ABC transporter substrate-binding protein n=1 Tax=Caldimonas brevitalea TaxID=413882 RepID=A0A0G3BV24_9BURK|nr:ABC transporter substrate-binding protein [Caldimonas brevitalea]AKJ31251.1 nitrate ABC transporter substrate-binding protein [Caldimonas brevitalea]
MDTTEQPLPPHEFDDGRRHLLKTVGAVTLLAAAGSARRAHSAPAQQPAAIRIAVAQAFTGTPPSFSASSMAIAHAKGWIEQEFAADGIKVEWYSFKGAGPAVNEALTNQQVDFAFQGDLPSIIGRAGGLKTRLVLATGVRANLYVAVPSGSPLRTLADLRGQRVSLFKGTNIHLPALRLLEAHGLREKDLRLVNLDTASALAAVSTNDVDAAIGGQDLLRLRDKGGIRILYTTKGQSPVYTRQSAVLVTDTFAQRYPEATARVVKAAVKTARWASDEAHREEVLRLWARAGTPYEHWKEDYAGEPLRVRLNPNFDPFLVARYKDAVEQAARFKLIRSKFDVDSWIDSRPLSAALKELRLETYWPVYQADGRVAGA